MKNADFVALFSETKLADVVAMLLSGQTSPPPDESPAENETVIGELTPFEKAVYTARHNAIQAYNKLADELNAGSPRSLQEVFAAKERLEPLDKQQDFLNDLFWDSIRHRLGKEATMSSKTHSGIGIRSGFAIVLMPSPESDNEGPLGDLIGTILGAAIMGGHDCDGCSKYDECDLPIKKMRAA